MEIAGWAWPYSMILVRRQAEPRLRATLSKWCDSGALLRTVYYGGDKNGHLGVQTCGNDQFWAPAYGARPQTVPA
jgi:hypothetical protein